MVHTINTTDTYIYTALIYQFHRRHSHYLVVLTTELLTSLAFSHITCKKPHPQGMLISNNGIIYYQLV